MNINYGLFDCKPQFIKLFSSFRTAFNQGRLTINRGLFIFFFTLSKAIDDAQSFLGHVFVDQTLI